MDTQDVFTGREVLELGAGTGVAGIVATLAGEWYLVEM